MMMRDIYHLKAAIETYGDLVAGVIITTMKWTTSPSGKIPRLQHGNGQSHGQQRVQIRIWLQLHLPIPRSFRIMTVVVINDMARTARIYMRNHST